LGTDPEIVKKYGKVRAIESPNLDPMLKRQALSDYDKPIVSDGSSMLLKRQAS
jgi:hypothetical protein